jgi:sterol desaturase/sphingolipid hydroxylase (fatty acid hydroxylase superfamily)
MTLNEPKNTNGLIKFFTFQKEFYKRIKFYIPLNMIYTIFIFFIVTVIGKKIWPEKIANEGKFIFLSAMVIHEVSWIIGNGIFCILYHIKYFDNFKFDTTPWPWEGENKSKWNNQFNKTIITLLFNHFILAPAMALPSYIYDISPYRMDYDSLPSFSELFWQSIICYYIDDFFFYWSHRLLHWNKIYPYIHKQHHEYISTIGITAEYAHPIEYVFGNVISANMGPLILGKRMHGYTFLFNLFRKILQTTENHSGYEFKWSPIKFLPMLVSEEFHAYHHLNFKGNYGNCLLWDSLCSTVNDSYVDKLINSNKKTE